MYVRRHKNKFKLKKKQIELNKKASYYVFVISKKVSIESSQTTVSIPNRNNFWICERFFDSNQW